MSPEALESKASSLENVQAFRASHKGMTYSKALKGASKTYRSALVHRMSAAQMEEAKQMLCDTNLIVEQREKEAKEQQRAEAERLRAEAERLHAEAEMQRAETERQHEMEKKYKTIQSQTMRNPVPFAKLLYEFYKLGGFETHSEVKTLEGVNIGLKTRNNRQRKSQAEFEYWTTIFMTFKYGEKESHGKIDVQPEEISRVHDPVGNIKDALQELLVPTKIGTKK